MLRRCVVYPILLSLSSNYVVEVLPKDIKLDIRHDSLPSISRYVSPRN